MGVKKLVSVSTRFKMLKEAGVRSGYCDLASWSLKAD